MGVHKAGPNPIIFVVRSQREEGPSPCEIENRKCIVIIVHCISVFTVIRFTVVYPSLFE